MQNNSMSSVNNNIIAIVTDVQMIVLGLVIAAFAFVGICLIIPSDKAHEIGKKSLPFIAAGAIIALGAVSLGNWIYGKISF